jgi:hypothetical protein
LNNDDDDDDDDNDDDDDENIYLGLGLLKKFLFTLLTWT